MSLAKIATTSSYYVAVKASLYSVDCTVFGLNQEEVSALVTRFNSHDAGKVINGLIIKGPPLEVINALAQLGYKVVASTGEADIVWTLQREE